MQLLSLSSPAPYTKDQTNSNTHCAAGWKRSRSGHTVWAARTRWRAEVYCSSIIRVYTLSSTLHIAQRSVLLMTSQSCHYIRDTDSHQDLVLSSFKIRTFNIFQFLFFKSPTLSLPAIVTTHGRHWIGTFHRLLEQRFARERGIWRMNQINDKLCFLFMASGCNACKVQQSISLQCQYLPLHLAEPATPTTTSQKIKSDLGINGLRAWCTGTIFFSFLFTICICFSQVAWNIRRSCCQCGKNHNA